VPLDELLPPQAEAAVPSTIAARAAMVVLCIFASFDAPTLERRDERTMSLQPDLTDARAVVVVEGPSDQIAIETLARRRSIDLEAERVRVVCLGGAHKIGAFLGELGARDGARIGGLCDAGEEPVFRRALERAGFGADLTRTDLENLGFYVCDADLEEELIRAVGVPRVEEIIGANDDFHRFRTLQQMPEWRGRATEEQLRRFMGSGGRRKIRYARYLVDALDLGRVPRPLDRVLARALQR
jgi:hypothetical protein